MFKKKSKINVDFVGTHDVKCEVNGCKERALLNLTISKKEKLGNASLLMCEDHARYLYTQLQETLAKHQTQYIFKGKTYTDVSDVDAEIESVYGIHSSERKQEIWENEVETIIV